MSHFRVSEDQRHSKEKLVASDGECAVNQAYSMEETLVDISGAAAAQADSTVLVSRDIATQALQSIIHAHFEKTMEKKQQVDAQKKKLWKLFAFFFIFVAILFVGVIQAPRLKCHHSWTAIALFVCACFMFYVAMSQTLRVINGFKYQRRCHKLTLGLANDKLRTLRGTSLDSVPELEFEVRYQEPGEDYVNKFKRKWILFTLFLSVVVGVIVSSFASILCSSS